MGTTFVAGAYGVGKSTLRAILSQSMNVSTYSARDLISRVNGEKYGAIKAVQDKDNNQDILAWVVTEKLKQEISPKTEYTSSNRRTTFLISSFI